MKHKKQKSIILYDGSNVYHRLKELGFHNLLTFQFSKLHTVVTQDSLISATYYVGAIRTERNNPKSKTLFQKQLKLFSHLEKQDIRIVRGYMLKSGNTYHEKGVDVQIAIDLVIGAYEDTYDTAYLFSSDTDLIPAILKSQSLGKTICYVGFQPKISQAMLHNCKKHLLFSADDLKPFLS